MGHILNKTNQHVKYESSVINSFQDNERTMFDFFTRDLYDLDLHPSESKINRCHVLTKANENVKYNSSVINCF